MRANTTLWLFRPFKSYYSVWGWTFITFSCLSSIKWGGLRLDPLGLSSFPGHQRSAQLLYDYQKIPLQSINGWGFGNELKDCYWVEQLSYLALSLKLIFSWGESLYCGCCCENPFPMEAKVTSLEGSKDKPKYCYKSPDFNRPPDLSTTNVKVEVPFRPWNSVCREKQLQTNNKDLTHQNP